MKLITLYRRYTSINYKNSLCSFATLFVISVTIFAIVAPFYIAFSLFSDLWSQYKVVYEQPDIRFEYKYIFTAEFTKSSAAEAEISSIDTKIVVCSSYKYLNKALNDAMECSMIKVLNAIDGCYVSLMFSMLHNLQYWEKDTDFDHKTDQMALQMTVQSPTGYYLSDLNLFLQLDATLKVCYPTYSTPHLSQHIHLFLAENVSAQIACGRFTRTDAAPIEFQWWRNSRRCIVDCGTESRLLLSILFAFDSITFLP